MTHITRLNQTLTDAIPSLGFNPLEIEQRSWQWHNMRLGVITASQAVNVLAKRGSATREGYLARLVGEICTGLPQDEVTAKAMQWGIENEPKARQMYEFLTMEPVSSVPFIYSHSMRCGCSPDGILTGKPIGLEIKCPFTTKVHIETILDETIKKEYQAQMDFSLLVSGLDAWEFCSFDPRMQRKQLHTITWDRNDKRLAIMEEAVQEFITDMDRALLSIGFEFGEQWSAEIAKQQAEEENNASDDDGVEQF